MPGGLVERGAEQLSLGFDEASFAGYLEQQPDLLHLLYLLRNARYVMKPPFFNYPVARGYLSQASALDSENWEIWVNAATISLLEGNVEVGRSELTRAIALKGDADGMTDWSVAPFLDEALAKSGLDLGMLGEGR